MNSLFDDRRDAIKLSSQKQIAKGNNADRQARDRARKQVKASAGFSNLPADAQNYAIRSAEEDIMTQRASKGHDTDTKRALILDKESAEIFKIDEEEKAGRLKLLAGTVNEGKGTKRKREYDSTEETIRQAFNKRLTPIIEKMERQIIAGGATIVPGVSQEQLDKFAAEASNPEDVADYLEYWSTPGTDLDEGLGPYLKYEEDDDDNEELEIVVSEDEEDDSEEEDDFKDFIVDDTKV